MRALIIEDNEDERDIILYNLRRLGFDSIVERSTLKAAIQTLTEAKERGECFDLITLDLKLQDSTPETTLASLPIIASFAASAPIMVVTGHPSRLTENVRSYAQGLLQKPYNFYDFTNEVNATMRSKKYRPLFPVALLIPRLRLA